VVPVIAVTVPAGVVLILGLVALVRANRDDIPSIVESLGRWLRGGG